MSEEPKLLPHPEDFCQRCSGKNGPWFTDSALWNKAHSEFSILCPVCFMELAAESGVSDHWFLQTEAERDAATQREKELEAKLRLTEGRLGLEYCHVLKAERDALKKQVEERTKNLVNAYNREKQTGDVIISLTEERDQLRERLTELERECTCHGCGAVLECDICGCHTHGQQKAMDLQALCGELAGALEEVETMFNGWTSWLEDSPYTPVQTKVEAALAHYREQQSK